MDLGGTKEPCIMNTYYEEYEKTMPRKDQGPDFTKYLARSTQPCIPPRSLNRVPASAGVRAGMSPLPGGR